MMALRSWFVHIGFCVALGLLGLHSKHASGASISELLPWVPADANSVVTIDVDALFRTSLGMRENWRKQAGDRFANQEIVVPPEAQRVVMASQLDLGGGLQPVWELGIMDVERTPSFALIARREGGHLDTIAGHSAVTLPGGRSGVELNPGVILVTSQPNRQIVSRWVASAKKGTSRLSTVLSKGLEQADSKSHLVVAMDLADSVTAAPIRELLTKFEPLKGKTADQADIADILASVKALTLAVRVTDKREGTVHVEFAKPTAIIQPIAKPLMEEILGTLQISLVDLDQWTATASGTSLTFKGEFSQADLRKIVSLFAASPGTHDVRETSGESSTPTPPSAETLKVEASQKYFRSVKGLLDDLRKTLDKTHRDNQLVWMERYARKIDDLPMKDVDKDLLTFGGNVSSSLRYQAQAARVSFLRSGVRIAQPVYQNYSYGAGAVGPYGTYGGYSFSGTVQVAPNFGQIRTEEHANAAQVKASEMKQIEDGLVQIRRAMTERYNVEF